VLLVATGTPPHFHAYPAAHGPAPVNASQLPEEAELADVLERCEDAAVTLEDVVSMASPYQKLRKSLETSRSEVNGMSVTCRWEQPERMEIVGNSRNFS
jgi:hypothetical protein